MLVTVLLLFFLFDMIIIIIIIKVIYKVQDHLRATSVLCRQWKCLLSKQKGLQL